MARNTFWIKLGAMIALAFAAVAMVFWFDLKEILQPNLVADWLREAGSFGPLVFIALMAAAVVISPIPSLPLDIAAGATFGPLLGTVYAVIGAEIGAIASFLIGRALGREILTRLLRTNIAFCERCSDRHLAIFVFLARLVPLFSFDIISYGAGLTNMSLQTFAAVTFVGMIPPTLALTYAGSQVVSGAWLLILSGLAMVGMMLLIPKLVLRYPTARWVRLLRGEMPAEAPVPVPSLQPAVAVERLVSRCDSCGGPVS
ncbi:MAG: TVP38/TMEM64 family protein [Nitrospira sp.]|nr:TVP38/TMEM64 family protein [Nitrospira sp.]